MKIVCMEVGMIGTNCYIAYDEAIKEGFIVDPGGDAERILDAVKKLGIKIGAIFLTHGHSDHIVALEEVRKALKVKVYMHSADTPILTKIGDLGLYMGQREACAPADEDLTDGEQLTVAGMDIKVLATPGHTPGGVCLVVANVVFCGDTIFAESIGRTDLPGGSYKQLLTSIKEKILTLSDDMQLLPGHGPGTTVGWERRRNPFLQ